MPFLARRLFSSGSPLSICRLASRHHVFLLQTTCSESGSFNILAPCYKLDRDANVYESTLPDKWQARHTRIAEGLVSLNSNIVWSDSQIFPKIQMMSPRSSQSPGVLVPWPVFSTISLGTHSSQFAIWHVEVTIEPFFFFRVQHLASRYQWLHAKRTGLKRDGLVMLVDRHVRIHDSLACDFADRANRVVCSSAYFK